MVEILTSKMLTEAGISHGFTLGEDFSTAAGFTALKQQLNTEGPIFKVKQVHGKQICTTSEMTPVDWADAATEEADAIIGDTAGCIGVVTADCVPILIACKDSGLTTAIHAGWRGLKAGVVQNTVKTMVKQGASVGSMVCAIGPCICLDCYEVSEDVADCFPESSDPIKGSHGLYLLDLAQAAEVSLIAVGLSTSQMDKIDICTSCGDKELYSYRKSDGECGRQFAFICK